MKVLIELLETATALGFSGAVAYLLGTTYVSVVAFVFVVCWLLMLDVAHRRGEALEQPVDVLAVGEITGAAMLFAAIWPAIPLILLVKGGRQPVQR